ncbi:hypothetical protein RB595_001731 [Gaeumannomyces hyphopodioides]
MSTQLNQASRMPLCGFQKPNKLTGEFMEILLSSTPSNQDHIIECYFAEDCTFSNPILRVPAFDYKDACIHSIRGWNSRRLVQALYRVQKALSPEGIVHVEARAFDKVENKVVLLLRQTFRILVPLCSADVKRIVVLQMQPVDVDRDGRPHEVRPANASDADQGRKRRPLSYDGDDEESLSSAAGTPTDLKGKGVETLSDRTLGVAGASGSTHEPAGPVQTTKAPSRRDSCACPLGSDCCRSRCVDCGCSDSSQAYPPAAGMTRRYMIKSQDDVYPLEELVMFVLMWPGALAVQCLQFVCALVVAAVVAPFVARQ